MYAEYTPNPPLTGPNKVEVVHPYLNKTDSQIPVFQSINFEMYYSFLFVLLCKTFFYVDVFIKYYECRRFNFLTGNLDK